MSSLSIAYTYSVFPSLPLPSYLSLSLPPSLFLLPLPLPLFQ